MSKLTLIEVNGEKYSVDAEYPIDFFPDGEEKKILDWPKYFRSTTVFRNRALGKILVCTHIKEVEYVASSTNTSKGSTALPYANS